MSAPTAGPLCPRCRRKLAAWRLDHCVYCGETLPAGLKEAHEAPAGLQWVERPPLPTDLSKKLELMKVVPIEARRKSRPLVATIGTVVLQRGVLPGDPSSDIASASDTRYARHMSTPSPQKATASPQAAPRP